MNVIRCTNGHFFDGDVYQLCPHCGMAAGQPSSPAPVAEPKKKGFFGGLLRANSKPHHEQPVVPQQMQMNTPQVSQSPYPAVPVQQPIVPVSQQMPNGVYMDQPIFFDNTTSQGFEPNPPARPIEQKDKKSGHTLDFWDASSTESGFGEKKAEGVQQVPQQMPVSSPQISQNPYPAVPPQNASVPQYMNATYQPPMAQQSSQVPSYQQASAPQYVPPMNPQTQLPEQQAYTIPETPRNVTEIETVFPEEKGASETYEAPLEESVEEAKIDPAVEEQENTTPLREAIKQASANSAGKTLSYFSAIASDSPSDKGAQKKQIDPVVGWLVCIHGPHLGESFGLFSGANSLGRDNSNRVVLGSDPSISRSKHAIITYEPKHRDFYIKPGESSGLTYLNDEYITETKKISKDAVIELGECKFIFIPLCGEDFTWEEYINA